MDIITSRPASAPTYLVGDCVLESPQALKDDKKAPAYVLGSVLAHLWSPRDPVSYGSRQRRATEPQVVIQFVLIATESAHNLF